MKKVIVTKGLPCAGKSTWAKQQVDANPGKYKIISKDNMRAMFDNSKYSKGNENFVLKARDALILLALQEGYHVLVDDTNLHPKHIETIKELVKGLAVVEIQDFTHVSLEECIERDRKRPNYVGEQVIRRMHRDFLQPTPIAPIYNSALPNALIVDMDGTLALFDRKAVSAYSRDFTKDDLNRAVYTLLHRYANDTTIFILSGRQEKDREATTQWLKTNNVPYDYLYMRQTDDKRSDYIVKQELYNKYIKDQCNIIAAIDDRLSVCRLWHELGLPLFRVGDPDADY